MSWSSPGFHLLLHSQRALVPSALRRAAALGREGCELSAGSSRWSGVYGSPSCFPREVSSSSMPMPRNLYLQAPPYSWTLGPRFLFFFSFVIELTRTFSKVCPGHCLSQFGLLSLKYACWGASSAEIYFSLPWKLGSPRPRCWAPGSQMVVFVFSHGDRQRETEREKGRGERAHTHTHGALPHGLITSHLQIQLLGGLEFQYTSSEGTQTFSA